MGYRLAGIVLVFMCSTIAAQSNEWPAIFAVPVKSDTTADSAKVRLSSDASMFQNTEKTNSRLDWKPVLSSWQLQQRFVFATSYESGQSATNQLYDFSGSVMRDSVLPKNGSLGLEWAPVSSLKLRDSAGEFLTTDDFGPVMQWKPYDVPLRIKGGISGSGWNSRLPARLVDSRLKDFHGVAGFYGAFSAGDLTNRFLGRPLYINTEAFVSSISEVGIAVVDGSALFAHEIGSGDSLFAFYGDSLSNGKERYWGSSGGQQQYINSPWRIARSFQASGGIKSKKRLGLQPAIVYSYTENAVKYPKLEGGLSDVRTRLQSLNLLLGTKATLPATYKGGFKVSWGTEEWLFGKDLSALDTSIKSLNAKLNDHQVYRAATDHYVEVLLPRGISLEYRLVVFRDSKTYTFEYINNFQSHRKGADDDAITLNHHLGAKLQQFHGLDVELYGEYSVYTETYLKKEMSSANNTEDGYSLGLNLTYKPSERFMLSERVRADAEVFDYFYKQSHLNDPPPYNRRFSSLCTGTWKINDRWELNGRWDEGYFDYGVWNGSAYFDSTRPTSWGVDYYAITNKSTRYSVELGLAMVGKKFRIESGCRLEDIFDRSYRNNAYQIKGEDIGYKVEPFTEFLFDYHWLSLRGRIARMINTQATDKWVFRKNWDIHIAGQASW